MGSMGTTYVEQGLPKMLGRNDVQLTQLTGLSSGDKTFSSKMHLSKDNGCQTQQHCRDW